MRTASRLLVAPLLALPLGAQGAEWVTNGSFTGTLAPWVMGGGYSYNPGLDIGWDTTGMGASDSFGCSPGGQTIPPPYPANTIEQSIIVVNGLTYEFRCDASSGRPGGNSNADAGTIRAEVNGVQVAIFSFGGYTPGEIMRTQVCGRFAPTVSGPTTLRIFFQRWYASDFSTPRVNIDNVSVKNVVGPTFWIDSNRKIGTSVVCAVRGDANAPYATFIAAGELNPGVQVPGVSGLLMLNGTAVMMRLATLDGMGIGNNNLAVPNQTWLLTTPFWFQAGMSSGSTISLGYDFGVVFTH
jgi:hypothetical protein